MKWVGVNRKITKTLIRRSKKGMNTPLSLYSFLTRKMKARLIKSDRKWRDFCKEANICRRCLPVILILFLFSPTAEAETASWYSTEACQFNPNPKCPTASGRSLYELEEKGESFAAMWGVDFGTRVNVLNIENGRSVVVKILDRGPAHYLGRDIDLSKSAFEKIGETSQGLLNVNLEIL